MMNRLIKMQEDEYPLSSHQYDQGFFNHCLTTFYNNDSDDEIIQARCSVHEVVCYLEHNIDLCDTPLAEIMSSVDTNVNFRGVDMELLRRKIIKRKNQLKRNRAKNRIVGPEERRTKITVINQTNEQDEELKRQRNRISAQISRDRKKERVKELQEMNRKLQEECEARRIETEKLKKEIQNNQQNPGNLLAHSLKNKFTRLLILLGIIFLFGVIKNAFSLSQNTIVPVVELKTAEKTQTNTEPLFDVDKEKDKLQLLKSIEDPLKELLEDKSLVSHVQKRVSQEINELNQQNKMMPRKLLEQVTNMRSIGFF